MPRYLTITVPPWYFIDGWRPSHPAYIYIWHMTTLATLPCPVVYKEGLREPMPSTLALSVVSHKCQYVTDGLLAPEFSLTRYSKSPNSLMKALTFMELLRACRRVVSSCGGTSSSWGTSAAATVAFSYRAAQRSVARRSTKHTTVSYAVRDVRSCKSSGQKNRHTIQLAMPSALFAQGMSHFLLLWFVSYSRRCRVAKKALRRQFLRAASNWTVMVAGGQGILPASDGNSTEAAQTFSCGSIAMCCATQCTHGETLGDGGKVQMCQHCGTKQLSHV